MRLIIDEICGLEQALDDKLAKFIRCLFQTILSSREDLALQLLQEACTLAKDSLTVSR